MMLLAKISQVTQWKIKCRLLRKNKKGYYYADTDAGMTDEVDNKDDKCYDNLKIRLEIIFVIQSIEEKKMIIFSKGCQVAWLEWLEL